MPIKVYDPKPSVRYDLIFNTHELENLEKTIRKMNGTVGKMPVKVIFSDPATILFWNDGTKTVVKCQPDETFDPEKGVAMAIAKRALGNEGNYYNIIKKCIEIGNANISDKKEGK